MNERLTPDDLASIRAYWADSDGWHSEPGGIAFDAQNVIPRLLDDVVALTAERDKERKRREGFQRGAIHLSEVLTQTQSDLETMEKQYNEAVARGRDTAQALFETEQAAVAEAATLRSALERFRRIYEGEYDADANFKMPPFLLKAFAQPGPGADLLVACRAADDWISADIEVSEENGVPCPEGRAIIDALRKLIGEVQ